jgi:hypothetical protein
MPFVTIENQTDASTQNPRIFVEKSVHCFNIAGPMASVINSLCIHSQHAD